MDSVTLTGKYVQLTAAEPKELSQAFQSWNQDSEYLRLLDARAANQFSAKKIAEWIEKDQEKTPPAEYLFGIRTLAGNNLVGFIDLEGVMFPHGDAFVGIGLGERDLWGKGYGTDAMKVILRYAFKELNLRRVSLDTFEYNLRAIRSYEKAGFVREGCARRFLFREGRRWGMIYMGILREEWQAQNLDH